MWHPPIDMAVYMSLSLYLYYKNIKYITAIKKIIKKWYCGNHFRLSWFEKPNTQRSNISAYLTTLIWQILEVAHALFASSGIQISLNVLLPCFRLVIICIINFGKKKIVSIYMMFMFISFLLFVLWRYCFPSQATCKLKSWSFVNLRLAITW